MLADAAGQMSGSNHYCKAVLVKFGIINGNLPVLFYTTIQ